jgi:spoIIIJ-associated protein
MEWVEITARTLEEARDIAFDQLGIDEHDAEVEILEEPRPGLFGRLRGQARIRARVRPTAPRPKVDRRDRRRRGGRRNNEAATLSSSSTDGPEQTASAETTAAPAAVTTETRERTGGSRRRRRGGRGRGRGGQRQAGAGEQQEGPTVEDLSIDQQAEVVAEFLGGLAGALGAEATTSTERIDDETVEVRLDGTDLGLLIGHRGDTLQAVQELARTAVQRRGGSTQQGRVRIDIAGYRQRRRAALERFARQVAERVLENGSRMALEPMNAADRKVVHDTVNEIDGVRTISEGEEPRRRVVLLPDT